MWKFHELTQAALSWGTIAQVNDVTHGPLVLRSPESLRWPIAMGWRLSSSIMRCALTSSSQELLGQS